MNIQQSTLSATALETALISVLACYDITPDIKGILARLSRHEGPLREDDIVLLCQHLKLTLSVGIQTKEEIQSTGVPAVIIYQDNGIGTYIPTEGEGGQFKSFNNPASLEGGILRVYTILPPEAQSQTSTDHMKYGNRLDWFWEPVKTHWKQYSEIIVASLFSNILMLALPVFSMNIYDRVSVNYSQSTLTVLTVGIILALLFDFLFKTLRSHILESVAARVGISYDMELMRRFLSIKPNTLALSIGEKANLFRELQSIKDFYAGRLMPALVDVPFFFLFVWVMYLISPILALVPVIAAIIVILITKGLQVPVNRSTEAYFKGMQHKSATLIQILSGIDTIRMLGATGGQLFNWHNVNQHSAQTNRHNIMMVNIVSFLSIMIIYMVNVFVLVIGVYEVSQGNLTVGGMVACSLLSGRAIGPIISLSGLISKMKQSSDVLKTIDKVYTLPHDDDQLIQSTPKNLTQGSIEFANVSFAYPNQPRPALQKVSFTIKAGERVGIIGRTGAGKSTLVRLVTRFLEPVTGSIFIDGYAMNNISPEELHRSIGYVPQDGTFFTGTIRANILMGASNTDEEILQNAVRLSGLESILQSMGGGLDMHVGEGGKNLSGGQKQAVALARSLVRNPTILVFDEPVNGIDNGLEATIKQGLQSYLTGRTLIMITHRTSLLPLVDRLILLEGGQIVADGPRDFILSKLSGNDGNE